MDRKSQGFEGASMTTEQPNALRLADALKNNTSLVGADQIAAELRRLHAEVESYREKYKATYDGLEACARENTRLHAVNAALVEALKEFVSISGDPAGFEAEMATKEGDDFVRFIEQQEARVQRAITAGSAALSNAKATAAVAAPQALSVAEQPCTAYSVMEETAAFKAYIQECDACAIVPDVGGAFHDGWCRASRVQATGTPS